MKQLLLGVGNRLAGDDGAGPAVARRLSGASGWIAIDCGTSLENAAGIVVREKPDLLVIVDAARMGLPAGSARRLPMTSRDRMLASTHGLPLTFVLERVASSAVETVLIGIEPETLEFGEMLSAVVQAAVRDVAESLVRQGPAAFPVHDIAVSAGLQGDNSG